MRIQSSARTVDLAPFRKHTEPGKTVAASSAGLSYLS